jgi:hypothetical protein
MAYRRCITLNLGTGLTGATLAAQLCDPVGANVGGSITAGFVEFGTTGIYIWDYASFPDAHRGGVKFTANGTLVDVVSINPEGDAEPSVIALALLDLVDAIESGITPRKALRIALAALAGKASGLAGVTAVYRAADDSKDRITATVDANGNRTAVTIDAT